MRLLKIFSVSFIAQGMLLAIGFVNSIIITRNLGVSGRGQYAMTMNIVLVLALILGDGLFRSNTYYVSIDRKMFSLLFSNSVIALLIVVVFVLPLPLWLNERLLDIILPGLNPTLILFAAMSVIPQIYLRSINGLLLGMQKYYAYNIYLVVPLFVFLMLNVGLMFFNLFTPEQVMMNYFAAWMVVVLVATSWLVVSEGFKFSPNLKIAVKSLKTGLKASVSHICLFLLFRVDIFLLNFFLGVEKAGIYSIAVLVSELLQKLANTSGTIIFPKLTGKQTDRGRQLSLRIGGFVVLIGIVFSILIIFLGESMIILLYKEDFAMAVQPLYFLLPGTTIMAGGKILLFSLWGQNFPRITVVVPLIAFIMNAILNALLIPKLGVNGAAISTSISYCFFGVTLAVYYFSKQPASVSQQPINVDVVQ